MAKTLTKYIGILFPSNRVKVVEALHEKDAYNQLISKDEEVIILAPEQARKLVSHLLTANQPEIKEETSELNDKLFLVSGALLELLATGGINIDKVRNLDHRALFSWCGEDIMRMLEPDSGFYMDGKPLPTSPDQRDLLIEKIWRILGSEYVYELVADALYDALKPGR